MSRPAALIAMVLLAGTVFAAEPAADYYIAPDGNDAWTGRLPAPNAGRTDGPFASIAGARDALRKSRPAKPTTVLLRGGVYRIEAAVEFTPEDTGTEAAPITYAAYPGEQPVLSAGRRITGWKKGDGNVWTATVPPTWTFNQLFADGQRQIRARHPNEGFLRTDGPIAPLGDREAARKNPQTKIGFRIAPDDLRHFADRDTLNVFVYHSWTASMHWIAEFDEAQRIVRFTAPSGWPVGWWEAKQRYHLENFRAAVDAPSEWYVDRSGTVHWYPPEGVDPAKADVVAPVARQLLVFRGDPEGGRFIEHLHFKGISFQHADWRVKDRGPADGQSAVGFLTGAIHATGLRHSTFIDCEIAHIGEYALWLARGCSDNLVQRCHIHDMGGGGVCLGETSLPSNAAIAAQRNTVDNCFIHHGGRVFPQAIGAWIGRSSHNRISHNDISDFYYTGVSVGWTWGYATPSHAHHNIVEFNHIHHLGDFVLSDMAGIYTLGISPGSVCRNNLIHDVYSYSYGGWGLYTDEGSSDMLWENNIVHNTKSGGFHQHYGRDNTVRNNILAFAWEGQVIRSRQEEHNSFNFERNIVYARHPKMLGSNWGNNRYTMDRNLYFNAAGGGVEFSGESFEKWQARGHDRNSIVADPLFVNPAAYDFRLKENSPALKLGFVPIDPAKIGLYGDEAWISRPGAIPRKPAPTPR